MPPPAPRRLRTHVQTHLTFCLRVDYPEVLFGAFMPATTRVPQFYSSEPNTPSQACFSSLCGPLQGDSPPFTLPLPAACPSWGPQTHPVHPPRAGSRNTSPQRPTCSFWRKPSPSPEPVQRLSLWSYHCLPLIHSCLSEGTTSPERLQHAALGVSCSCPNRGHSWFSATLLTPERLVGEMEHSALFAAVGVTDTPSFVGTLQAPDFPS